MFRQSLPSLFLFLQTDYFPKITQFKFESSVYQFESPLNFLMLRSDFKEFLESFYQAEALLHYALSFHIDSMFTLAHTGDKAHNRKQIASDLMLRAFHTSVLECVEILREYDHLVPHDT